MTAGEKIQLYRKQAGMSQEELGQKLLVSRQTVSLWEKDQTVPTIDNLIRLREIFGVSLDEMLGLDNKEKADEASPNEAYVFNYTKDEMKEIHRSDIINYLKRPAIIAALFVFLLVSLIDSSAPDFMIGIVFGIFLIYLLFYFKGIYIYHKQYKNSLQRVCGSTYEYNLFEKYFTVRIHRKNEKVRDLKISFTEIEKVQQTEKWIFLQITGQVFIVRKSDLSDNSAFYSYMFNNPIKIAETPARGKWKISSDVLFAASILSLFGAMSLDSSIFAATNSLNDYKWIFFLFTPIPIASVVLGFILKSKGYKYKKNIVVGVVIAFSLCVFGSFTFTFGDVFEHSDEPVIKVEQMTGIDIPEYTQINTLNLTEGTQTITRGYIYTVSNLYFDDLATVEFEKSIAFDDRWLTTVPNDLIGITSPWFGSDSPDDSDYVLIYDTHTSKYNSLPEEDGEFNFINIFYNTEENEMCIVDYEIFYVK